MHETCKTATLLVAYLACVACQRGGMDQPAVSLDTPNTVDVAQLKADGAGPTQVAMDPTVAHGPAYVTQTALVRREAKESKDVEVAGSKRRLPNWTATLYRGEQVTLVQAAAGWVQVRTSDEKTGWLKDDNILGADGIDMVTVVMPTKTFTRPDLLALNGGRTIAPGTLLFALRAKDQFSEVNLGGSVTGWVLTDVLVKDRREVDVAKLINKARLLKNRNDPAADGLLELAKAHFADTHLVQSLLLPPTEAAGEGAAGGGLTPGPEGLGAPGVVAAPRAPVAPAASTAEVLPIPDGLPAGGVDTAPSAPAPVH